VSGAGTSAGNEFATSVNVDTGGEFAKVSQVIDFLISADFGTREK